MKPLVTESRHSRKTGLVSLLLAAALLTLCVSCGTDPVIRRLQKNGGLKIGYCSCAPAEDAPFVMAQQHGISAEPIAGLAQTLDIDVSLTRLASSEAYAQLRSGFVDCLWNVPSPAKQDVPAVRTIETGVYYRQLIMTTAASDITRLADVSGKTLAVVSGSDAQTELHNAPVMESSLKEIKVYASMTQVIDALTAGEAHCAAVDEPQARYTAAQRGAEMKWIDTPLAEHSLVIATRAEDADLCALLAGQYIRLSQTDRIQALCEQYAPGGDLLHTVQTPSASI